MFSLIFYYAYSRWKTLRDVMSLFNWRVSRCDESWSPLIIRIAQRCNLSKASRKYLLERAILGVWTILNLKPDQCLYSRITWLGVKKRRPLFKSRSFRDAFDCAIYPLLNWNTPTLLCDSNLQYVLPSGFGTDKTCTSSKRIIYLSCIFHASLSPRKRWHVL